MLTISEKIAKICEEKGMTKRAIAERLGVKPPYVTMMASGKSEPSKRVSKLIDELLEGKKREPHPDPYIESVIKMMEQMDEESRKHIQVSVKKDELFRELMKERQEREAA